MTGPLSGLTSMNFPPDHMHAMEKELANLKSQLEVTLFVYVVMITPLSCIYLLYHFLSYSK